MDEFTMQVGLDFLEHPDLVQFRDLPRGVEQPLLNPQNDERIGWVTVSEIKRPEMTSLIIKIKSNHPQHQQFFAKILATAREISAKKTGHNLSAKESDADYISPMY